MTRFEFVSIILMNAIQSHVYISVFSINMIESSISLSLCPVYRSVSRFALEIDSTNRLLSRCDRWWFVNQTILMSIPQYTEIHIFTLKHSVLSRTFYLHIYLFLNWISNDFIQHSHFLNVFRVFFLRWVSASVLQSVLFSLFFSY